MSPRCHCRLIAALICVSVFASAVVHAQDYWTPPAPPKVDASKMRTMNEIEPRTVIYTLPCSITNPGSYVIVKDMTGSPNSNGITIAASDVSLDLNGFSLIGVPSSLAGITVSGSRERIRVRNGNIRDWGGKGISAMSSSNSRFDSLLLYSNGSGISDQALSAGPNSIIEECVALNNSGTGINTLDGCKIENCTARDNQSYGIAAGQNSIIEGCTAAGNTYSGFYVQKNCIISRCNAIQNGAHGFYATWNCSVSYCTSATNTQHGFLVGRGSVVSFSTALENGNGFYIYHGTVLHDCSAYHNTNDGVVVYSMASAVIRDTSSIENGGDGIDAAPGTRVTGCMVRDQTNTGKCGIRAGADCHIVNNTAINNYYGIYEAGGAIISDNVVVDNTNGIYTAFSGQQSVVFRNTARGNGTDYSFNNDAYGPLITTTGVITNLNPWANFDL